MKGTMKGKKKRGKKIKFSRLNKQFNQYVYNSIKKIIKISAHVRLCLRFRFKRIEREKKEKKTFSIQKINNNCNAMIAFNFCIERFLFIIESFKPREKKFDFKNLKKHKRPRKQKQNDLLFVLKEADGLATIIITVMNLLMFIY